MTVQAKQQLVTDVVQEIGDFLTVTNTNKVGDILTEALTGYDLIELTPQQIGQTSLNYMELFLDAKRVEGRSEKTICRYSYTLEKALMAIGTPVDKITVFHIRTYLMDEKKRGLQDSSVEGLRNVLSSFFGWLWKEGLLPKNPCANIGPIKCQKKIRLPYSPVELQKIRNACKTSRDKALVAFLLASGARISEVCALDIKDVNFRDLDCKVLGKGNKERTVYIDTVTAMELQAYLEQRTDNSAALFAGKGTKRMTPHGVRERLKDIGEAAGVENVHPHRFRRTLATNLINHGMQLQDVALILGHENVNTTLKYVFIDKANVENSYRRYA